MIDNCKLLDNFDESHLLFNLLLCYKYAIPSPEYLYMDTRCLGQLFPVSRPLNSAHLKLSDVSVLHHDGEEPHDHLGARPQHHLPLTSLLGIAYAPKRVSETVHTNHSFWKQLENFTLTLIVVTAV